MKERPILMSAPTVRALLSGAKTQTRRVVRPQPQTDHVLCMPDGQLPGILRDGTPIGARPCPRRGWMFCPYGSPTWRDRLWVRETWAPADQMYESHECDPPKVVAYRADHSAISWHKEPPQPVPECDLASWGWDTLRWRPSIHMPLWASRITLELTEVRVQRVQEISEEDAEAEGDPKRGLIASENTHAAWFRSLWDEINGPRGFGWDRNPYVWCLSFRRLDETPEAP